MIDDLPPDPFADNPLVQVDAEALGLLQAEEVDYFELFPNLYYADISDYATTFINDFVPGAMTDTPAIAEVDHMALAGLLIHGIMIGARSQHIDRFPPTA